MRACGIATPPPVPVEPSASRFDSSSEILSAGMPSAAAARSASSRNRRGLSDAATSTRASAGDRNSVMFMNPVLVQVLKWSHFRTGKPDSTFPENAPHSIRRAQAIADAGFGEDDLWSLGIGLDLLAQLPDIDP